MSTSRAWTLMASLLLGCAADSGGLPTDGGNGNDGAVNYCDMGFSFSPAQPQTPTTLVVTGSIGKVGLIGVETYTWSVTFDGMAVPFTPRDALSSEIELTADQAGPYRVTLSGSVDGIGCTDTVSTINVTDPVNPPKSFRLRFVPTPGQPAPVQDRVVSIPGGADYVLGTLGLDNGIAVGGTVSDSASQPLAGYLRASHTGGLGLPPAEAFADGAGAFSLRLMPGSYDVLVVPEGATVAPALIADQAVSALGAVTVPDGEPVSGVVLGPGGAPVVGATVSLRAGGVPSTLAVTDLSGAFTVQTRTGVAASLVVTPAPGSGLPRLEIAESAGLMPSSSAPLAIQYDAGLTSRAVSTDVVFDDGSTAAPAARLTFVARAIADAGTVTPQGGSAVVASGGLRATVEADGSGRVTGLVLPEAVYDVLVAPAPASSQRLSLVTADLSAGQPTPSTFQLGATASVTGAVTTDGSPVQGVRVTAWPRGLLANVPGAGASATTDSSGAFNLEVIGSGEYELVFDSADMRLGRTRATITAPPFGASGLGTIAMRAAIRVSGTVTIPGVAGGAVGVHVMLLCYECSGVVARTPVAEAVSDGNGNFALALPDPAEDP